MQISLTNLLNSAACVLPQTLRLVKAIMCCPLAPFKILHFLFHCGGQGPGPEGLDACHTMQALYAKASANLGSFHEPSRRWWQQRRVAAASKAERAELAALEARLSLEEIAHFRAGVAAVHSRLLAPNHAVLQVLHFATLVK